jgi:hypothetical protein
MRLIHSINQYTLAELSVYQNSVNFYKQITSFGTWNYFSFA